MWGPFPSYSTRTRRGSRVTVSGCCLPIPLGLVLGAGMLRERCVAEPMKRGRDRAHAPAEIISLKARFSATAPSAGLRDSLKRTQ